ncbi:hypothetical protein CEXT_215911 [Caerostris extrusa]|uniref:Uncharacterized protein n=1 Tax=Caerostris extrusa TaxID=172846 RepID=A0AAV4SUJ4_CAEEX|nr:hypothetical protein CEXT_215911 [Caerostris extrusa]
MVPEKTKRSPFSVDGTVPSLETKSMLRWRVGHSKINFFEERRLMGQILDRLAKGAIYDSIKVFPLEVASSETPIQRRGAIIQSERLVKFRSPR